MSSATFNKADLAPAISSAALLCDPRSVHDILQSVRIVCADGTATITGTDLCGSASMACPYEGDDLTAVIDGAAAAGFAKKAGDKVKISLDDDRATLSSGRARLSLLSRKPSDFPQGKRHDGDTNCVDADVLRSALSRVTYAMGGSEAQPYYNGVSVISDSDGCRIVAANGLLLSKVDIPPLGIIENAVIPKEAVTLLLKAMPQSGEVRVTPSDVAIRFEFDGGSINSQLIDRKYPDYTRILRDNAPTIQLDADALSAALDRLSLAGDISAVTFMQEDGGFALSAHDRTGRKAKDFIDAEIDGDPIPKFGLVPRQVIPMLVTFDGAVRVNFAAANAPLIFLSDAQPDRLALASPIKV